MFKKYILSSAVVFSFLAYAFHQKIEDISAAKSVVPPTLQPTPDKTISLTTPSETNNNFSPTTKITATPKPKGAYNDGVYTGDVTDAFYGLVQVEATVAGGRISDVQFLQYPSDRRTSIEINSQAMPYLRQEAIAAQSAQVDIVSGATQTSRAFIESLASALAQAK